MIKKKPNSEYYELKKKGLKLLEELSEADLIDIGLTQNGKKEKKSYLWV